MHLVGSLTTHRRSRESMAETADWSYAPQQ